MTVRDCYLKLVQRRKEVGSLRAVPQQMDERKRADLVQDSHAEDIPFQASSVEDLCRGEMLTD